jgi:hypothetical protein
LILSAHIDFPASDILGSLSDAECPTEGGAVRVARRAAALLFRLLRDRRPGRVILPANVCPVVPAAVRRAGHAIELVDVDEHNLALDLDRALDLVRGDPNSYSALIFVRPYGADFDVAPQLRELRRLAEDLLLVDDRCLCLPRLDAVRADVVDACLWSTGPRKPLDLGGGGFADLRPGVRLASDTGDFDPAASALAEEHWRERIAARAPVVGDGGGAWLDLRPAELDWPEYRARIAAQLPAVAAGKAQLNAIYTAIIPAEAQLAPEYQDWRFNVRVADPDALCAALVSRGLFAGRHYAPLGGVFAGDCDAFPRARRLHAEIVNLFNDRYFDAARAEAAAVVVREHCRQPVGRGR